MTFFGKSRSTSLFDQQAYLRNTEQKAQKRKHFTLFVFKAVLGFVIAIVLLNLAVRLPALYTKVAKPFNSIQSQFYSVDGLNFGKRTNLLLVTVRENSLKELALASLEPGNKKVVVLRLPTETSIFGKEGAKKLTELPVYQKNNLQNIDQLSAGVLETLNYIPDGYIVVQDSPDWLNTQSLNSIVTETSFTPSFFLHLGGYKDFLDKHLWTNLTVAEFYQLTSAVKRIPPERFELIDTQKYQDQAGFIDSQSLLSEVGVRLNDKAVVDENLAVEVVNGSGMDGLGLVFKNVVNNLGANVVAVNSTDFVQEKSTVLSKSKSNPLAERLANLFGVKVKGEADIGSVDVKITLGKDFGKFFDY